MDTSCMLDLPPVPDCFSRLLVGEQTASHLPNQPWREVEKLKELKDVMLKTLAKDSVPDAKSLPNGDLSVKEDSLDFEDIEEMTGTPFTRLNRALSTLKKEMASLRHLDMSLFCQLLSLNEAIQDFKISMHERYSEYTGSEYTGSEYNGSEYSFGGMGSRTGSFSSLIEETEWGNELRMNFEDLNSPGSAGEGVSDLGDITSSASSLLQQIAALTKRAEADFSL